MLNKAVQVFDFLKIKHKHKDQERSISILRYPLVLLHPLLISLLLSIGTTWLAYSYEESNYLLSDRFADLFTLLAILPGFYIASLSAISAINRKAIDKYINEDNPPFLIKPNKGFPGTYEQPLTRRIYLTMLFAYLSAVSLLLTINLTIIRFLFSIEVIKDFFLLSNFEYIPIVVYFFISVVILFFITQLILLTLVGINYLGYSALVNE